MSKTLFSQIIDREIPAEFEYEDEDCIVIRDIHPVAPVHVLLIPKEPIAMLNQIDDQHAHLVAKLMQKVPAITKQLGIGDDFRLVINNGAEAGQTVFHMHIHLIGGRPMTWPPG